MGEDKTNAVMRQFSLKSFWDRLVRVALVGLGSIVLLEHVPADTMEWIGVAIAVLGASYTGA